MKQGIAHDYWRRTRNFTLLLLALWFGATFGIVFFARELDNFTLFGWPFSFYMAAQGLTLLYLTIVGIYALRMQALDRDIKNNKDDAADAH